MSETANIAQMAVQLAKSISRFARWEQVGPNDIDWQCVQPHHNKKTHPADAVYTYHDPYDGKLTQVLFDFKSLAAQSISTRSIVSALKSLALSLDCAMVSDSFTKYFPVPHDEDKKVIACLFVYNHDHAYTKNLNNQIANNIKEDWPKLKRHSEIIILDPETLIYLNSIQFDYWATKGQENIPDNAVGFFQPDHQLQYHRRSCSNRYSSPLMLEQLVAPFHVIRFGIDQAGKEGYILYYRGKGESSDEFIHLIDYLFTYQVMDSASKITFKLPNATNISYPNFQKSKKEYAEMVAPNSSVAKMILERLSIIDMTSISIVKPQFFESELGMRS
jgi:hypothetical protein